MSVGSPLETTSRVKRDGGKERRIETDRENDPLNDERSAVSPSFSPETTARFAKPLSRDQR